MGSKKKGIWIGVIILALIGIGLGLYYYFFYPRPSEVPVPVAEQPYVKEPSPPTPEKVIIAEEKEKKEKKEIPPAPLVKLGQSDDLVRERAKGLSPHPEFYNLLKIKNIIRRITAAVDNIAEGLSPAPHLNFLAPQKPFTAKKEGEKLYLDPQSYQRYNLLADMFQSLNAEATIRTYRVLYPLFQEAYRELGYPRRDFQDTLIRAIKELLRAPMVEGEILLEERVISYQIVDDDLEYLSDAQKNLIRMGPRNTRKIQEKLREMALALGVPEYQLPKARLYATKAK